MFLIRRCPQFGLTNRVRRARDRSETNDLARVSYRAIPESAVGETEFRRGRNDSRFDAVDGARESNEEYNNTRIMQNFTREITYVKKGRRDGPYLYTRYMKKKCARKYIAARSTEYP